MNAPMEPENFYEEGEKTGVVISNIISLFSPRVEKIQSGILKQGIFQLLLRIQERMNRGDLGKALVLIHNIPLEYSLHEGVSLDDRTLCNDLYTELLREHDRLFEILFPMQFRKKTDQILKNTSN